MKKSIGWSKSPENQAILDRIIELDDHDPVQKEEADRLRRQMYYSPDTFVSNMLQDGGRERLYKKGVQTRNSGDEIWKRMA